jgi:hypothetical protein
MINIEIKPQKIKENVFTASICKKCCVSETFLISYLGFKRKDIQKWILSLNEPEFKAKVIRLEGRVLEDFKAEYLRDFRFAAYDSLYLITSDGLRSLFVHYEKNKSGLTKNDKANIAQLSQRFINVFSEIQTKRISHLVFWEEEVKDEINIPDMPNININNSPGAMVATGDHNNQHHVENRKRNENRVKKPQWVIWLSWIFIIGSIVWFLFHIGCELCDSPSSPEFKFDWREIIQFFGLLIGIILKIY